MADFNVNALLQQLQANAEEHFSNQLLDTHELEENLYILREFEQKAVELMQQEGKIELPDLPMPIVYDQKIATQTLTLFHYGILAILDKFSALHITDDPKQQIAQLCALGIFNQAKQITASTFGQEYTPDYQISNEQQRSYIQQGAESHFIHFLGQYEQQHGPIDKPADAGFDDLVQPKATVAPSVNVVNDSDNENDDDWFSDFDESELDEDNDGWLDDLKTPPQHQGPLPLPTAPEPILQAPIPKPTSMASAPKYAAVALLLNTLTPPLQQRVLAHFNANEQMLINSYCQDPDRIPRETDVQLVNQHLRQFKQLMEQGSHSLHSNAYRHIQHLTQAYSQEDVLSCIERERPNIKHYISGFYATKTAQGLEKSASVVLPGKVEEILYHHLQKALSYR